MKMGNAFAMGIGVTQSDSEALKFFALACDLESEWGCQDYEILKERARCKGANLLTKLTTLDAF